MAQSTELAGRVIDLLAVRIQHRTDRVVLPVQSRTSKRLLELAGDQDEFTLTLTQGEMANLIGSSRERVNRSISELVRLGMVARHGSVYRIVDRPRLEERARH